MEGLCREALVFFGVVVRHGCIYGGPILRCLSDMGDPQSKHDRDRSAISDRNTIPSRVGCSQTQSWLNCGQRLPRSSGVNDWRNRCGAARARGVPGTVYRLHMSTGSINSE